MEASGGEEGVKGFTPTRDRTLVFPSVPSSSVAYLAKFAP